MTSPRQPAKTLRKDAADLVEQCPGLHSRLAARRITHFLEREMKKHGFSLVQVGLMAQIASAADDRLDALVKQTGLDQSTLSRNLARLERKGLVEITKVETDLRRRAVWLTEGGARMLELAIPYWRRAQADLAKRIAPNAAHRLADQTEALVKEPVERT